MRLEDTKPRQEKKKNNAKKHKGWQMCNEEKRRGEKHILK